ncbi:TonB family protein [Parvibaculum sp.]|uniref:TonB family protein n=1 Tax=Parvibaculum sp. TaxID=2024848 RepID=UPI0034A08A57
MSMAAIASGRATDEGHGSSAFDPSHRALRLPMAASFLIHAGLFAGALFWWQGEGQQAPRGTPDAVHVTLVHFSEPAPKPAREAAEPVAVPAAPVPVKPAPPVARKPEPAAPRKLAEPAPVPEPKPETAEAKPAEPQPAPASQALQTASLASTGSGGGDGASKGFRTTSGRASDDVHLVEPRFRVPPRPPVYPRRARDLAQEGIATIRVLLDTAGNAREIVVWRSSGFVLLDHAALTAARGWQYEPERRNGKPVDAWVQIPVRFALN